MIASERSRPSGLRAPRIPNYQLASDGGQPRDYDQELYEREFAIEKENVAVENDQLNGTHELAPIAFDFKLTMPIKQTLMKEINELIKESQYIFSGDVNVIKFVDVFQKFNDLSFSYNEYISDIIRDAEFARIWHTKLINLETIFKRIEERLKAIDDNKYSGTDKIKDTGAYNIYYLISIISQASQVIEMMLLNKNTSQYLSIANKPEETYISEGQIESSPQDEVIYKYDEKKEQKETEDIEKQEKADEIARQKAIDAAIQKQKDDDARRKKELEDSDIRRKDLEGRIVVSQGIIKQKELEAKEQEEKGETPNTETLEKERIEKAKLEAELSELPIVKKEAEERKQKEEAERKQKEDNEKKESNKKAKADLSASLNRIEAEIKAQEVIVYKAQRDYDQAKGTPPYKGVAALLATLEKERGTLEVLKIDRKDVMRQYQIILDSEKINTPKPTPPPKDVEDSKDPEVNYKKSADELNNYYRGDPSAESDRFYKFLFLNIAPQMYKTKPTDLQMANIRNYKCGLITLGNFDIAPMRKGSRTKQKTPFFADYKKALAATKPGEYYNPMTQAILTEIFDKYVNQTANPTFLEDTTKYLIDEQK